MGSLRYLKEYVAQLEREFERLEKEIGEKLEKFWRVKNYIEPLTSILVTPDEVLVTADAPCCDPSSVEVKPVGERVIELRARIRKGIRLSELGIRRRGVLDLYKARIEIPVRVDLSHIRIRVRRGIIEVRVSRLP